MFSLQHQHRPQAVASSLAAPKEHTPAGRTNSHWQSLSMRIQPKLTLNQPGDHYEQEADRVADQVMRMPDQPKVQRLCTDCEDELQRRPDGRQEPELVAPAIVHDGIRSAGEPLDAETRGFMESRFGRGFGGVRVHTGPEAASAADSVSALAFTLGHNVVFAGGQYSPHTTAGRHLLAHELTHVVQQTRAPAENSRRSPVQGSAHAHVQRAGPAIPAGVLLVLAAAARFLVACIVGAAFGVGLDAIIQLAWADLQGLPFHWNTCYAIISGIVGCVSAGVGGVIARAIFRSTGGHLETGMVKAIVWFLTWLYGKVPVVPIAFILGQLVKLGCVSASEVPPEMQNPGAASAGS